ncbi:chemotaxis protein CheA [Pseudomonas aeruginosa]
MDTDDLLGQFFVEADELLVDMERHLIEVDADNPDTEQLNAIFRAAHSIKGGAGIFGFERLQRTTHIFENLLDKIRKGQISLSKDLVDYFLDAKDILRDQLQAYQAKEEPDQAVFEDICSKLQAITDNGGLGGGASEALTAPAEAKSVEHPIKITFKEVSESDRATLIDELKHFGPIVKGPENGSKDEVIIDCDEPVETISLVMGLVIDPDQVVVEKLDPALFKPAAPPAQPEAPAIAKAPASPSVKSDAKKSSAPVESSTLRVPVDKVDDIINLVGELVITQSMLTRSFNMGGGTNSADAMASLIQLQRNARDLQEAVMSIRMVPMDSVFSRFPRQVRDLAGKLNKEVELITEGKSTELDKSLVEKIVDPLSHLVRNSLDHGIETPDIRVAAGKPAKGRLTLAAAHQGGNIVIQVIDDGAGLNRDKLLAKAKQNGLDVSDSMSDEEVFQLIFAPGFSTAEVVSDVSGRGVGMDVVKRNIQSLGGQVIISSKKGQGTTTRIVLPLTMAILDGMSIRVGNQVYILPLSSVIESLQPQQSNVYKMSGTGQVLRVRDEHLPVVWTKEVFGVPGASNEIEDCIAVIVQSEGNRYALLVDDLVGEQQVVVKNLETNYQRVPGVSAATIMGDGSVAFILDVPELLRLGSRRKTA